MKKKITIIGAGEIGSAIGKILLKLGHEVYLWDIEPSKRSTAKTLAEVAASAEMIFLTVPSLALSSALISLKNFLPAETKLVCLTKGMERSGKIVPEIIQETVSNDFALLSGPMIAEELESGLPSFAVVAGSQEIFKLLQQLFLGSNLYLEYQADLRSVAYAGILKNVYTLLIGLAAGLGQGDNLRGFLLSAVLREWEELARRLDLNQEVLRGLAGLGDLLATSLSPYSRNRQLGERLVRGELNHLTSEGFESLLPLTQQLKAKTSEPIPKFLSALERVVLKKEEPKKVFQELIKI